MRGLPKNNAEGVEVAGAAYRYAGRKRNGNEKPRPSYLSRAAETRRMISVPVPALYVGTETAFSRAGVSCD